MSTPINNLTQSGFEESSAQPGCSGESENAPYGPKAAYECGIMEGKAEADTFNHAENGFAVGGVGDLTQAGMGESSVQP